MNEPVKLQRLERVLGRLAQVRVVPGAGEALEAGAASFARRVHERIVREVPAYSDSANPEVLPELEAHIASHVDEVLRLLGDGPVSEFGFVVEHARQRALQKFPLEAAHEAYRHLARALTEWVRDAALMSAASSAHVPRVVADVTDFLVEYMGTAATLLTSEYVDQTRILAEAEGDRRTRLLATLLEGYDESDPRSARLLRRAGYLEQRQSYCVVVARSVNPQEMENAARAQRMVDAISDVLQKTPLRFVAGVRDNLVVVVISGTRRISGYTRPLAELAEQAQPKLRLVGPAALIGISNDVPSTSHIPRAVNEARLALEFADVANRIVGYNDVPFRRVLLSHARDELQAATPAWLAPFSQADKRGKLAATLRAYADANMNLLKAAKLLSVHPNTIYARMQKIEDLTAQDPQSYHALTDMLLALEIHQQSGL